MGMSSSIVSLLGTNDLYTFLHAVTIFTSVIASRSKTQNAVTSQVILRKI